jgi:hypothetical protein
MLFIRSICLIFFTDNTHLSITSCVLKPGKLLLPSKWHNKLGTTDGGDYFLFILKSGEGEAIICRRII